MSNLAQTFLYFFSTSSKFLGNLIYPIKSIFEVIEYRIWLEKEFIHPQVFPYKNKLLDLLIRESSHGNPADLTFIEFGVAYGETAKYLSENVASEFSYHGFDTFTGLPRAWRKLPQGAFDAGGVVPDISIKNFHFHKGLISETISELDFAKTGRKVVLFDFDLFEPTLFSLEWIADDLNPGDILYFDEAFDADERLVIKSFFCEKFNYKLLGATVFGIAFVLV